MIVLGNVHVDQIDLRAARRIAEFHYEYGIGALLAFQCVARQACSFSRSGTISERDATGHVKGVT